ncbi:hypothetical protein [Streptomyces blattellae]|uniref:hypothetical protein n=1 Tax=Streptomyces blattellae TaxID=2569855 RepID=UPI0012B8248E|nr:hypothetical protein [Streptomyces blattellae]
MTALVVARVQDIEMTLGFVRYLKRIGTTLTPCGGRSELRRADSAGDVVAVHGV